MCSLGQRASGLGVVWEAHRDGCSSLSCCACLHHLRALLGREGLRRMERAACKTKHATRNQTACNMWYEVLRHSKRPNGPKRQPGWGCEMTGRACLHDRHYMVGGVVVRGAGEAALLEVGGQRLHRPCRAATNRPAACVHRKQQATVATLCIMLPMASPALECTHARTLVLLAATRLAFLACIGGPS